MSQLKWVMLCQHVEIYLSVTLESQPLENRVCFEKGIGTYMSNKSRRVEQILSQVWIVSSHSPYILCNTHTVYPFALCDTTTKYSSCWTAFLSSLPFLPHHVIPVPTIHGYGKEWSVLAWCLWSMEPLFMIQLWNSTMQVSTFNFKAS